jgi:nitrite reductase (NO-forming)
MKNLFFAAILIISFFTLAAWSQKPQFNLDASKERGKEIYLRNCVSCHMEEGEGLSGIFPPLAKSDYLLSNKKRAIEQTLYGIKGEMTVNGVMYDGEMNGFDMTDEETSDVLNYILNSFGNQAGTVTPTEVKATRKK